MTSHRINFRFSLDPIRSVSRVRDLTGTQRPHALQASPAAPGDTASRQPASQRPKLVLARHRKDSAGFFPPAPPASRKRLTGPPAGTSFRGPHQGNGAPALRSLCEPGLLSLRVRTGLGSLPPAKPDGKRGKKKIDWLSDSDYLPRPASRKLEARRGTNRSASVLENWIVRKSSVTSTGFGRVSSHEGAGRWRLFGVEHQPSVRTHYESARERVVVFPTSREWLSKFNWRV